MLGLIVGLCDKAGKLSVRMSLVAMAELQMLILIIQKGIVLQFLLHF